MKPKDLLAGLQRRDRTRAVLRMKYKPFWIRRDTYILPNYDLAAFIPHHWGTISATDIGQMGTVSAINLTPEQLAGLSAYTPGQIINIP